LKIPSETELELAETSEESEKFVEYCESNPQFSNAYNAIIGQVRHKGKHAGGIVITNKAIPLERTVLKGEIVAAWTEGKTSELSQAGIVKFDLLGLTALSIIRRLEKKVCKTPAYEPGGLEFNLFNIGDLTGIFQFSGSAGIRKYTQDFHPKVLDDLIMINALYRPGTLDVGVADKFLEWKKKPRKIHPLIDPHLESTFGAIVFQEQVMAIVAEVIGGSLGEADEARRLIVKARDMDEKWRKKFNALQSQFLKCAEEKGIDGEHLFEEIKSHARYSFNKAHSAAYAMIAWTMAWWKFNYPTQFYSELINTDPGEAQSYIMSACRHKIKVSVPDINVSTDECVVYKNVMYLPFSIVKSVSPQTACKIADIREREGKFTSAKDFMAKTNKTLRVNSREALYALGSFNSLSDISGKPELAKEILKLRNTSDLTSRNERHLKFMGLIIPTDDLIKLIETLRGDGYLVGIINSIDERISKYGPYQVARLTPSGVFWCRDRDLKVGQTVAVKAKNGKAITLEFL
jgi:DNA polymerase-3 subunit alpha